MICPNCGSRLKVILYTTYGRKILRDGRWVEDDSYGATEYECPECCEQIDFEELERLGVV